MEPWIFRQPASQPASQPVPDGDGLVRREVVSNDMHVEFGRNRFVDNDEKLLELDSTLWNLRWQSVFRRVVPSSR
jgi:hypothetical protein